MYFVKHNFEKCTLLYFLIHSGSAACFVIPLGFHSGSAACLVIPLGFAAIPLVPLLSPEVVNILIYGYG